MEAGVWHPKPRSSVGWRARLSLPPSWVHPACHTVRGSSRGLASGRLPLAAHRVLAGPGSGALSLQTTRRALRFCVIKHSGDDCHWTDRLWHDVKPCCHLRRDEKATGWWHGRRSQQHRSMGTSCQLQC
ncbi:protein CEI [Camelus ferus]|uniref:Protein CEI n=1 Tax=Camelus ferus TaxID=419612 RepID=A0A8B8S7R9_CAMFR|nr:protein CEI [Camelus ferus]